MKLPFSTLILAEQIYKDLADYINEGWDMALSDNGVITVYDPDEGNSWAITVQKTYASKSTK